LIRTRPRPYCIANRKADDELADVVANDGGTVTVLHTHRRHDNDFGMMMQIGAIPAPGQAPPG
jgi:hypothetical protein